jgi:hypothetical protein
MLFMSSDQWHHLEGTFAAPGIFRVFFYDDMTRPLAAAGFSGRVAKTDNAGREISPSVPLVAGKSRDGSTMEAQIPDSVFPLRVQLRLRFKPDDREQVFDFTFPDYSKDP